MYDLNGQFLFFISCENLSVIADFSLVCLQCSMILTMTGERRNDPMNVASENVLFATTTDKACDDSIEIISDGELSSDHEDGEISEGLSDIFR
jgi:hypothetical protein